MEVGCNIYKHMREFCVMLTRAASKFRIVRTTHISGLEGYHYDVIYPDPSRLKGDVDVYFDSLWDYQDSVEAYEKLISEGLAPIDKIADITGFFPNGDLKDKEVEKYTRKGVGSEVLKKVINDSLDNDCKAMIVFTGRPWMKDFLEKKHKFTPANALEYYILF